MKDFDEIKLTYRACIKNIISGTEYQSKDCFDSYKSAWSYLREHIPEGFEGFVISLPKLEFNLEFDELCHNQKTKNM